MKVSSSLPFFVVNQLIQHLRTFFVLRNFSCNVLNITYIFLYFLLHKI